MGKNVPAFSKVEKAWHFATLWLVPLTTTRLLRICDSYSTPVEWLVRWLRWGNRPGYRLIEGSGNPDSSGEEY